jgi:predicted amidohydrolase
MSPFNVASAQFPVSRPGSWNEYADQIRSWTAEAATRDARLVVYPEYAAMSLASLFDAAVQADLHRQIAALQDLRDDYVGLHTRLARELGIYLLAGSIPWRETTARGERYVNRAWLFSPNGDAGYQDKRIMTRFEREEWNIEAGDALKVFDTALGRIGVLICYDCEFPVLARAQAEAGAVLLLVPSCTDTAAGQQRVRLGAQARALENQCYTVLSPLVGEAPWSPAVDVNVGAAGIYCPPDRGFPDNGVIAEGRLNQPGWVYGVVDPAQVAGVRMQGQVLNFRDWPGQYTAISPLVEQRLF